LPRRIPRHAGLPHRFEQPLPRAELDEAPGGVSAYLITGSRSIRARLPAAPAGPSRGRTPARSHTHHGPPPLGDELILDALYATDGTAVGVEDRDLLADLREFGAREGPLLCPDGAACLTATRQLRRP
jgi:hypothetical protein